MYYSQHLHPFTLSAGNQQQTVISADVVVDANVVQYASLQMANFRRESEGGATLPALIGEMKSGDW